jgi:hypothetical protein|tara:strand:+ start:5899 stop:6576 length:678 start_codon:yes stop_codon:yes gene_type:complete
MINFCCVSYGTKYKPEYVQKLYNMVERHLTLPYKFICFTDQDQLLKRQVKGDIEYRRFKDHTLHGYWNKLQLFNEEENLEGVNFYTDLDVVIKQNINDMVTYGDDETIGVIRDFGQPQQWFNSSVLKFNNKITGFIWQDFIKDKRKWLKLQGDQNVITKLVKEHKKTKIFQDTWTQSYKWLDRSQTRFHRSTWTFEEYPKAKIVVFHGSPNPHESTMDWVKNHWK